MPGHARCLTNDGSIVITPENAILVTDRDAALRGIRNSFAVLVTAKTSPASSLRREQTAAPTGTPTTTTGGRVRSRLSLSLLYDKCKTLSWHLCHIKSGGAAGFNSGTA
jgi:hypothetical protein